MAIPVTDFERSPVYQSAVKYCTSKLETGLCIRVKMDQLVLPDLSTRIVSLIDGLGVNKVDEYVIERLIRGYWQELKDRKVIWIKGLISPAIRRLIVKSYRKIKKEIGDEDSKNTKKK